MYSPLLYCMRWIRSERSATNAHHLENVMKAPIRLMKSVAEWKLKLGDGALRRCGDEDQRVNGKTQLNHRRKRSNGLSWCMEQP